VASAFRPTFVRLPNAFSTCGALSGAFAANLAARFSDPLRLSSAFRSPGCVTPALTKSAQTGSGKVHSFGTQLLADPCTSPIRTRRRRELCREEVCDSTPS